MRAISGVNTPPAEISNTDCYETGKALGTYSRCKCRTRAVAAATMATYEPEYKGGADVSGEKSDQLPRQRHHRRRGEAAPCEAKREVRSWAPEGPAAPTPKRSANEARALRLRNVRGVPRRHRPHDKQFNKLHGAG